MVEHTFESKSYTSRCPIISAYFLGIFIFINTVVKGAANEEEESEKHEKQEIVRKEVCYIYLNAEFIKC